MDDYDCIVCDTKMKKCIVWPFLMDYCNNCFSKKVSSVHDMPDGNFSKEDLLHLLKRGSMEMGSFVMCLHKLDKNALFNTWYLSIYSIELLLNKFNKEHGTSLFISHVENDTRVLLTIDNLWAYERSESVVNALNDEIADNVYDEDIHEQMFVKSVMGYCVFLIANENVLE